jgi:hypothetical protein
MKRSGTKRHTGHHRREFLRHFGLGAAGVLAGLPLLESFRTSARAQVEVPRRLLVLFTPNGTILDEFFAADPNGAARFGRILEPLEPFRDQVLLLDGLSMGVTALGPGNEHQRGMAAWLTGHPNDDGEFCGGNNCQSGRSGWATSASVDQLVAQARVGLTPLASLELGIRVEGTNNRHRMSFSGPALPVAPDDDPRSVYRRLYGQSTADLEGQVCVTELVAAQYRALSPRVSSADRTRLEAHLGAVEGIETRLRALASSPACSAHPSQPPAVEVTDAKRYADLTQLQTDLLVAAFRCDSTRVASVMWSGATAKVLPQWLNRDSYREFAFKTSMSEGFHAYTHEPFRDPSLGPQAEVRNKLLTIYRWYATAVARLLASLQSVTEPDGSTLLDNTLVVWGSELASPDVHSFDRMPFVVAGGSKFLRTGQYIDYHGEQHTALLATVALAMGLPDSRFGHPDFARSPLYELLRG